MKLQNIIDAWNNQADNHNQWHELDADERVTFALQHIEAQACQALDDLGIAVYAPEKSGVSVAHAIGHVKQIFSCGTN
jgi:hypothetical protein